MPVTTQSRGTPLRLVVFAPDTPYPAFRGGRADIWRRILAFRALGHEVMLVHLFESTGPLAPSAADLTAMDRVVSARFGFPMQRGWRKTLRQLMGLWHTPWHAATRVPQGETALRLRQAVMGFAPNLMWLDGPWFGPAVEDLADALDQPFAYRSHNVEHQYLWGQAAAAVRFRDRWAWRLACFGVQRLERRLMDSACAVFDISKDDLAFWQTQGVKRLHWLPPLPELAVVPFAGEVVPAQVLFMGNLSTPNNVRGVEFMVEQVWPLVLAVCPAAKLTVVGSNPTAHVAACIARAPAVELRQNVAEPAAHLLGAQVLVNPVMTGSGVQLKMLDMLMTQARVVTTSQGLRGLPEEARSTVVVADGAQAFASAVCEALSAPAEEAWRQQRQAVQALFGVDSVAQALNGLGLPSRGHA